MNRKRIIVVVLAIAAVGSGGFLLFRNSENNIPVKETEEATPVREDPVPRVIGTSAEGRAIESYTYGNGETHLTFIGAIHGGYEWNTVLLAHMFMDYLKANQGNIPKNMRVTVVPVANPDGVYKVFGTTKQFTSADAPSTEKTIPGRFNARGVDLNRNFDCNWEPKGVWRGTAVSGGDAAFSEPEAAAIRDFVQETSPALVIFWHSAANGVYGANCGGDILPEARTLMNLYAKASGYPAIASFDHYKVTGDAEGWLAKIGVPSLSVELVTHETVEWERNKAGVQALFKYYESKK